MSEEKKLAKAGSLLCIDRGAWSNYQVTGFFVVLREFDPMESLQKYFVDHPEQNDDYSFKEDEFLAYLLSLGLLLEVEYGTLYLSDYGRASTVSFTPSKSSDI